MIKDDLGMDDIALWTRFKLPLTEELPVRDKSREEPIASKWLSILRPLYQSKGYHGSLIGRVEEDQEVVVLVSEWWQRSQFDEWYASQDRQLHADALASISLADPTTYSTAGDRFLRLENWTVDVYTIYFYKSRVESREVQLELSQLHGLRRSTGHPDNRPFHEFPQRRWVLEDVTYQDHPASAMLWFHTWRGNSVEKDFKESTGGWDYKIFVRWFSEMQERGMRGYNEEHIFFQRTP